MRLFQNPVAIEDFVSVYQLREFMIAKAVGSRKSDHSHPQDTSFSGFEVHQLRHEPLSLFSCFFGSATPSPEPRALASGKYLSHLEAEPVSVSELFDGLGENGLSSGVYPAIHPFSLAVYSRRAKSYLKVFGMPNH